MPDIFLRPGEPNPNDVKLLDPTTTSGAATQVGVSLSVSWRLINSVTQSRSLSWRIKNLVTQSKTISWRIKNVVTQSRSIAYKILEVTAATVGISLEISWRLNNLVSKSLATLWKINGVTPPTTQVAAPSGQRRRVRRKQVAASLVMAYRIHALRHSEVRMQWRILNNLSAALVLALRILPKPQPFQTVFQPKPYSKILLRELDEDLALVIELRDKKREKQRT